jgi:hypothetical protein
MLLIPKKGFDTLPVQVGRRCNGLRLVGSYHTHKYRAGVPVPYWTRLNVSWKSVFECALVLNDIVIPAEDLSIATPTHKVILGADVLVLY